MPNYLSVKKIFLLIFTILGFTCAQGNIINLSTDQVLDSLDWYIANARTFDSEMYKNIAADKQKLKTQRTKDRAQTYLRIGEMYSKVNIDSAVHYLDLGRELAILINEEESIVKLDMALLRTIPYRGMLHYAIVGIDRYNTDSLPRQVRPYYYGTRQAIYSIAADLVKNDSISALYTQQASQSIDSLNIYLRKDRSAYLYFTTLRAHLQKDKVRESELANKLAIGIDTLTFSDSLYAASASLIGEIKLANDDTDEAIKYLALSAIADIKNCNAGGTALYRLGRLLHEKGDMEHSYLYLTTAIDWTVQKGARLRAVEIADNLPYVLEANNKINKNKGLWTLVIITILLLLIVALLYRIFSRKRDTQNTQQLIVHLEAQLKRNNYIVLKMLDSYASQIENYEEMSKLVARKIKAKQLNDLLAMAESESFVQKSLQQFSSDFDKAFIALYPDFAGQVNVLLEPEYRIDPEDAKKALTVDLRLMAMIGLGVIDSQILSRFLGLSINTIYTYRTKLKNRAIDRQNFEENLQKIVQTPK